MSIMINIAGIILIGFIVWWFWIAEAKSHAVLNQQAHNIIDITVDDGVYQPANIRVVQGQDVVLRFTRKDASPCAEKVIFAELDKVVELPINQPVDISLNISEPGKYSFTCDMQMYRGSLQVV